MTTLQAVVKLPFADTKQLTAAAEEGAADEKEEITAEDAVSFDPIIISHCMK